MRAVYGVFARLLLFFASSAVLAETIDISTLARPLRFLALGDSYTIGEAVSEGKSWPQQLGRQLTARRELSILVDVIAATGWTTSDLLRALDSASSIAEPKVSYDLVALQIGVNNQFQGRSEAEYRREFELLLRRSIALAGGRAERVFVLSIPDYAFTTYGLANGQGSADISQAINHFNAANASISQRYQVARMDVTAISRRGLADARLIASDGLHPSAVQYGLWVGALLEECGTKNSAFRTIAVLCY